MHNKLLLASTKHLKFCLPKRKRTQRGIFPNRIPSLKYARKSLLLHFNDRGEIGNLWYNGMYNKAIPTFGLLDENLKVSPKLFTNMLPWRSQLAKFIVLWHGPLKFNVLQPKLNLWSNHINLWLIQNRKLWPCKWKVFCVSSFQRCGLAVFITALNEIKDCSRILILWILLGVTEFITRFASTQNETCANKRKTETRGFEFFSTELNTCTDTFVL